MLKYLATAAASLCAGVAIAVLADRVIEDKVYSVMEDVMGPPPSSYDQDAPEFESVH